MSWPCPMRKASANPMSSPSPSSDRLCDELENDHRRTGDQRPNVQEIVVRKCEEPDDPGHRGHDNQQDGPDPLSTVRSSHEVHCAPGECGSRKHEQCELLERA